MEIRRKNPGQAQLVRNRENGIEYLTFPAFSQTGVVGHLVSTRLGGVSDGIYSAMNYSYNRGDVKDSVDENFRRTAALFHTTPDAFVCSDQTHTTNVRVVTEADRGKGVVRPKDYADVDGLVTNTAGLILSTFYADCVPLLFVDPVKRAVGCSHSGWRGTAARMGRRTAEAMRKAFGCRFEDILAAIGPSICRDCYEVGEEVAQEFAAFSAGVCEKKADGKYQLDLWKANEEVLLDAGILPEHISVTDICTCCNPDYLFSHRASKGRRGNFGAFIMLKQSDADCNGSDRSAH